MTKAVSTALSVGYRQFDLAEIYSTQAAVGQAFATAFADSVVKRDNLFLISKLDGLPGSTSQSQDYASTKQRVQNMLKEVNVDYFDLLLIHFPLASGTGNDVLTGDPSSISTSENWTLYVESLAVAWEHMSRLRQDGLVKHVGLSNCYLQHLEAFSTLLRTEAGLAVSVQSSELAPIYAIQNFIDAAHPESELLEFCKENQCHCLAYRPVVFIPVYGLLDGMADLMQSEATARGLNTLHELVLYWLMTKTVSPVVSSVTKAHIVSNYSVGLKFQQERDMKESQSVDEDLKSVLSSMNDVMRRIAGESETVDMMGGVDEYALAFKAMMGTTTDN
eukprot:CAMPEP_0114476592 /NCGR_PEP_ID=MMETSP0104-20121206/14843_1 /TAXON_ID=37642 ORGANISM="Paraphysomonas imperforata, Strain PA2" /NCGR_SAMPLE_ID=MMETSP0104 /ASSEMBLY_ACC=CAM_ASM_000202 /LENGTH=332 /DNA_ID=CAMNT_0001651345 /DNA_START=26 /DNA_END=1023 /DNA_ORIENTATION=+